MDMTGDSNTAQDHPPQTLPRGSSISETGIECVRQTFEELYGSIEKWRNDGSNKQKIIPTFSNVFQYINSSFFYETLANFGPAIRLSHFYGSINLGDKFVAKVINVFERYADVLLVWSPKRNIFDLNIKASLKLIDSKRYNDKSRYHHASNDPMTELEVSELVCVQVISFNGTTKKIELIRCKSINDNLIDDENEDDDAILNEKYRAKSSEDTVFHEYMMDHSDLRNPALIKQQTFTSLLHGPLVVECINSKIKKQILENKEDKDIVFLEQKQPEKREMDNSRHKNSDHRRNTINESLNRKQYDSSSYKHNSGYQQSSRDLPMKRTRSADDHSIQTQISRTKTYSSESYDSDSSGPTSSDDSRHDRRKHKKHKKSHSHKKKSRKHGKSKSKKSKKSKRYHRDKHRRHRSKSDDGHNSDASTNSRHSSRKNIDSKILKLLKHT